MKKKLIFLFGLVLLPTLIFSQTSGELQSDTISKNRIKFTVNLIGEIGDLETVRIEVYQQNETDTLLIQEAHYSMQENDPSEFYSLVKNENNILFGLGSFDMENYRCRLFIKRENGTETEISLN